MYFISLSRYFVFNLITNKNERYRQDCPSWFHFQTWIIFPFTSLLAKRNNKFKIQFAEVLRNVCSSFCIICHLSPLLHTIKRKSPSPTEDDRELRHLWRLTVSYPAHCWLYSSLHAYPSRLDTSLLNWYLCAFLARMASVGLSELQKYGRKRTEIKLISWWTNRFRVKRTFWYIHDKQWALNRGKWRKEKRLIIECRWT